MPPLRKPNDFWGTTDEIEVRLLRETDERMRKRLTAILMLSGGQSQKVVAQELNVCIATVRNWRKQWNAGGIAALRPRHIGTSRMDATFRTGMERQGFRYTRLSNNFFAYVPTMAGPLDRIEENCENLGEPVVMRHITQRELFAEMFD